MKAQRFGLILGFLLFFIVLFLPLSGLNPVGKKVLATAILMAVWWITEAIPIPATSLLPLVLFPLLGVLKAKEVALPYANEKIFLFLGGFFIAKAMEKHELHRRIALRITLYLGTEPKRLILGFMVATAFLSMWISNTATTMMMLPIAIAVMQNFKGKGSVSFGKALSLAIAYSASIGGIATLVGTPPNIVLAGQAKELFPGGSEITFARWFLVGFPVLLLFLPLTWLLLTRFLIKVKSGSEGASREVLQKDLEQMGSMKRGEEITLFVFVLVALLWIFRSKLSFGFFEIPGWSDLLGLHRYVADSTVAVLGALSLFLIPLSLRNWEFVLDWKTAVNIPWGIVLLFGGGFALAHGFKVSGLSRWIGTQLVILKGLPVPILIIGTSLVMTFLTELTSNTATTTLMLPILASIAASIGVNPYLLMIPATISASCAFMLPVATPPNAIVFGSGYLRIPDMAKVGIWMNLVGLLIVFLVTYFIAVPVFGIR